MYVRRLGILAAEFPPLFEGFVCRVPPLAHRCRVLGVEQQTLQFQRKPVRSGENVAHRGVRRLKIVLALQVQSMLHAELVIECCVLRISLCAVVSDTAHLFALSLVKDAEPYNQPDPPA